MRLLARTLLCLALVAGILVVGTPQVLAQGVTTGALSGLVTAADDGFALPGAVVEAVHQPTGTRYTAVSRADGRWTMQNVRVGGPYTLTVNMDGFRSSVTQGVDVNLGEDTNIPTPLQLDAVSETLTVTADFDPLINPSKTGVNTNVSEEAIENLPTINRGLEDYARLSPYFSVTGGGSGDEESVIAVAGRNNRYNNIQIDGAVNNDLFGLAGSGTPGGQAATQPISIDAVQEIALEVTPYDVRQGGFSGGGINVITKNGTNEFSGSAYYYTRDQDLVGEGPFDADVSEFSNDEYGLTLGGPIVRDKVFFFLSGEQTEREEPAGFSADNSAGQQFENPAAAAEFRNILIDQYGYDPGGLGEFTEQRGSDKLFARLDWNVADNHQLTFRHNFVDADNDIYRTDSQFYAFPSTNYDFFNETNSTVLQLNSTWTDVFNEFRVTYQTIEDRRTGADPFPAIDVELDGNLGISAGTEPFSTKNALDQEIFELTNDLTWLVGDHQITVGTHNEIFSFDNLFIRQAFGDYSFTSLEAFRQGRAQSYDYSFSATDDPNQSAKFDVTQLGFYAGDQWRVADNLSLTYGLRVDVPQFPDEPSRNVQSEELFGFRTDVTADGNEIWSPRIGFNWDPTGEAKFQLRGGVGLFSGRTPYVWISNQYGNTGLEFTRISAFIDEDEFDIDNNFIPFVPDPNGQPTTVPGVRTFTNEINLIDPNFEFPQVLRTSLGFDAELPWNLNATVEGIYSQTESDVLFQNLAVVPTGETLPLDGRPTYTRGVGGVSSAILLTDTNEGKQESYSAQLTRPFRNGFYAQLGYIYNDSEVVFDGTSSQANSNWRNHEIKFDPNNPEVGTSDFEIKHRFNVGTTYTVDMFGGWSSTFGAFFNAQSGQPYSTTFSNDVNGDFETNDLFYVPGSQDEVIITGGTWEELDAYIRSDDGLDSARGSIVDRNASRSPWRHQLDFSYTLDIPVVSSFRTQLKLDIFNVANLIDSEDGVVEYVNFGETSPVRYGGIDEATGKPIYQLNRTVADPDSRFFTDDLRSRWQARIGLRVSF